MDSPVPCALADLSSVRRSVYVEEGALPLSVILSGRIETPFLPSPSVSPSVLLSGREARAGVEGPGAWVPVCSRSSVPGKGSWPQRGCFPGGTWPEALGPPCSQAKSSEHPTRQVLRFSRSCLAPAQEDRRRKQGRLVGCTLRITENNAKVLYPSAFPG